MTAPAREITIGRHDLARLLLQFRYELERRSQSEPCWTHGGDYDTSFERMADILDESYGKSDSRFRCNHDSPVYKWPEAYTGRWLNIQDCTDRAAPKLMHLSGGMESLCGFAFTSDDIVQRPAHDYDKCPVCVREIGIRGNVTVLN